MELARWLAFRIYQMNPYIKPPRANTVTQYLRLPWEAPTKEEVEETAASCAVSEEEAAVLNKIFEQLHKDREASLNG